MEPDMNPAKDAQAIGRCLRIGQKKKVYVTRLITKQSVEERILSLMKDRRNTEQKDNGNLGQKTKLTEEDYEYLFGFGQESDDEESDEGETEEDCDDNDDDESEDEI